MNKNSYEYGALSLAFLGDSVLETLIRKRLVETGINDTGSLTEKAHSLSCAPSQSDRLENIIEYLTEEEKEIYLRARNHKVKVHPHSATAAQYRRATGLEAIFGLLYLNEAFDRINFLFNLIYPNDL